MSSTDCTKTRRGTGFLKKPRMPHCSGARLDLGIRVARHREDGGVPEVRLLAQPLEQAEAVQARQVDVEHDELRLEQLDLLQPLDPILGERHVEPGRFELQRESAPEVGMVLDDEHRLHAPVVDHRHVGLERFQQDGITLERV
jgi:hypothetical protein